MKWFRIATDAPTSHHVAATLAQTAVFWITFLVVLPALVMAVEHRLALPSMWSLVPCALEIGLPLLVAASALGLWTGLLMAVRGRGTPLPLVAARELVCTGPYRVIRNPMALAGITQGVAVGIWCSSVAVVLYALAGAVLWHLTARAAEETFLAQRFGASFDAYQRRVPLWLPRLLPRRTERWLAPPVLALAAAAWWPWASASLEHAYVALPLPTLGMLLGALLWTRNREPAVTPLLRTP